MVGSVAAELIASLVARGWTLATAESITAGGIGAAITTVPGSSDAFRGGLITYASDLKVSLAGVDADWVAEHGVVNAETASQMAIGAARVCRADVAVAVTGTAGPQGEDGVPPGVVWCGVIAPGLSEPIVRRFDLTGNRDAVRTATIAAALDLVMAVLKKVSASDSVGPRD